MHGTLFLSAKHRKPLNKIFAIVFFLLLFIQMKKMSISVHESSLWFTVSRSHNYITLYIFIQTHEENITLLISWSVN